jgi:hypothetical protein
MKLVLRSLAASLLLLPSLAFAWKQEAQFGATVHEHKFKRVVVESSDCNLEYALYFSAPAAGYSSGSPDRDYYRYRARINLKGGKIVLSPVFGNRAAGERVYRRSYDTTADGCWAKEQQKVTGVDVEACRGKGCTPPPIP